MKKKEYEGELDDLMENEDHSEIKSITDKAFGKSNVKW